MSSVANSVPSLPVDAEPKSPAPWLTIAWFSALLILCYFPILRQLMGQWYNDEDMSHGFFVPVIAGYIAWQNKDKLFESGLRTNNWGLVILVFAAVQVYIAGMAAELFTQRTAIIESIIGITLYLGGVPALKILSFPIVLLLFMVPIPSVIYTRITFPLQIFASQVAEFSLNLMGYAVLRDGNVLELASQKLSVVEACSGIRSLISLGFLSLVYAYFFDARVWMRYFLFAATIPIAILANSARVTLTGILSEIRPDLAHGFFHSASGWVIFMIALFILVTVHQTISRIIKATHPDAI
ncbi:MAG: exosortase/archaeosortase family protein [Bryobacteraceae bacterium]